MVDAQLFSTWLTPAYLFILLNIILATIFYNHHSKTNNKHHQTATVASTSSQPHPHPQLTRTPSLFSRVASFNFSHYYHSEPSHLSHDSHHPNNSAEAEAEVGEKLARAPSLMYRVASFKFGWTSPQGKKVNEQEEVEVARESHVMREGEEKVEVKVKKKAVKKKKVKKEAVEEKTTAFKREDDEEVDSKADDFINKFKHQLKLQRLESMLRYRNNDTSA